MGEEDSGEKTEEPTPHKLREARKKGQIAKSKDMTSAIMLVVSFLSLKVLGTHIWTQLVDFSFFAYSFIPESFTPSVAGYMMSHGLDVIFKIMLPMMGIMFLTAILVEGAQTGFEFFMSGPLDPDIKKLNPIEGFKKLFTMKQLVELMKSIFKILIVIVVLFFAIKDEVDMIIIAQRMTLWQTTAFTGGLVIKVILRVGLVYFILAILDYMYQRYEFFKNLRMTKKEVKDEYKRLEGDPVIKQRQREAQRQMAQGRQMGAVPGSDVVVTNPIHIALALRYDPNTMSAPVVVAKGKRLIADAIREVAESHQIPIIENPPLAREMYSSVEVDAALPDKFFAAVAEILAFVYNLNKNKRRNNY